METAQKTAIISDKATHKLIAGMVGKVVRATALRTDSTFVEDTAADILVTLFHKLDAFDPTRASVNTFIGTIAKNATVDAMRAYKGVVSFDTVKGATSPGIEASSDDDSGEQHVDSVWDRYETRRFHSPESSLIVREATDRINRYLMTLTERDRDVWDTISADASVEAAEAVAVRWGMGSVPKVMEEGRTEAWYRARSVRTLYSRIKANVEAVADFE